MKTRQQGNSASKFFLEYDTGKNITYFGILGREGPV